MTGQRRPLLPASPLAINHAVLTGTLTAEPQPARGPTGEDVTLLHVAFPVVDPDHPRMLWTSASYLVEVPAARAKRDIEQLQAGASLLAAGQLSERWMIENGHTSRRGVILATMVKSGSPETRIELPPYE